MDVIDALYQRRSIREFEDRDVAEDVLDRILEHALQSPSASNAQPYRLAVARGEVCEQIRKELYQKYARASKVRRMPLPLKIWHGLTQNVLPDGDYNPDVKYPAELQKRRAECGMGLYETLGIERDDFASRDRQMGRNFEFFGAPVAIFVFANDTLGRYASLDAGIFMQSLMLAAMNEGLGTCSQGALALWSSPIKKHFDVPKDYKLLCGMSLGYPKDSKVNGYQPSKRSLEELCLGSL